MPLSAPGGAGHNPRLRTHVKKERSAARAVKREPAPARVKPERKSGPVPLDADTIELTDSEDEWRRNVSAPPAVV